MHCCWSNKNIIYECSIYYAYLSIFLKLFMLAWIKSQVNVFFYKVPFPLSEANLCEWKLPFYDAFEGFYGILQFSKKEKKKNFSHENVCLLCFLISLKKIFQWFFRSHQYHFIFYRPVIKIKFSAWNLIVGTACYCINILILNNFILKYFDNPDLP